MTNLVPLIVTNKLLVTAAYKYVASAVMLTNCNLFMQQVGLPPETNISSAHVSPPRLMGLAGNVVTKKYFWGFGHGHLANFQNRKFQSAESSGGIRKQYEEWAQMTSQIGTNETRQLALGWLAAIGIDTAVLEKKYPCAVIQRFFYRTGSGQLEELSKVPLPVFEVNWGSISFGRHDYRLPAVSMTIFGPTKELIEYHLMDDSLMLRPKLAVRSPEALLAITDSTFYQFDDLQRSNLVSQFSP